MIAVAAVMCVYLYGLKGRLPDGIERLPWCMYLKVMLLPCIVILGIAGSLISFNFLWNICYTGCASVLSSLPPHLHELMIDTQFTHLIFISAEQAVGVVIAAFFVATLFLPAISGCLGCCGCVPSPPPPPPPVPPPSDIYIITRFNLVILTREWVMR